MIKEFDIISAVRKRARINKGVLIGIGDDAAVVEPSADAQLIACCDLSVEGIHFRCEWSPPELTGHKALAVTLSDVAAMGGRPRHAMVSIALRRDTTPDFVERLLDGIFDLAERFNVSIIGGDTSKSSGPLFIDTVVLGECDRGAAVARSGARVGDLVFVTGTLGGSALGLLLLQHGYRIDASGRVAGSDYESSGSGDERACFEAMMRHLAPTPRVNEGRVIGESGIATSMIDVSDGLSTDLSHLMQESGCGAVIRRQSLPLADSLRVLATPGSGIIEQDGGPLRLALHGGEDYELLFTAGPSALEQVGELSREIGIQITEIGAMVDGRALFFDDRGMVEVISPSGYEHII